MIKIIVKKSPRSDFFYEIIFENIPSGNWPELAILVDVINSRILTQIQAETTMDVDLRVEESGDLIVRYEDLDVDDFYIAFYNTFYDPFWEKICKEKYGKDWFVWDKETPMLRFSQTNFEQVLISWKYIITNKPIFLIITQDSVGWIEVKTKEALNQEECLLVQRYAEHKEKLRQEDRERATKRDQELKKYLS